jgi:hypothetical protein
MKPFKTRSKLILKNVVVSWYGEIISKILKEKLIKSIRIKSHLDISIMHPLGIKFLTNKKNSFQKDLRNQNLILTFQSS